MSDVPGMVLQDRVVVMKVAFEEKLFRIDCMKNDLKDVEREITTLTSMLRAHDPPEVSEVKLAELKCAVMIEEEELLKINESYDEIKKRIIEAKTIEAQETAKAITLLSTIACETESFKYQCDNRVDAVVPARELCHMLREDIRSLGCELDYLASPYGRPKSSITDSMTLRLKMLNVIRSQREDIQRQINQLTSGRLV